MSCERSSEDWPISEAGAPAEAGLTEKAVRWRKLIPLC